MPNIDLFLIAGQSNARGFGGDSTGTPTVTNGSLQYKSGSLQPLADPAFDAANGSAWPAFANAYGLCALASGAVSSTNLIASSGGSGTWSDSSLFDDAVAQAVAAKAALEGAGWTVTFRGVLWCQGEQDAINSSLTEVQIRDQYAAGLEDLYDRFVAEFDPSIKMWVSRTGKPGTGGGDFIRGQAVRDGQDLAAATVPGIELAFADAITFPDEGWMADYYHYNQDGYNAMGTGLGFSVALDLQVSFYGELYGELYDGGSGSPPLVDDAYGDAYRETYGVPQETSYVDVEPVVFDAHATDTLSPEFDIGANDPVAFSATGALTATAQIIPLGIDHTVPSVALGATGALSAATVTVEGPGGQDITVESITFRATARAYTQPLRRRTHPGRTLLTTATEAIWAALEAAQVNVWRVVDVLNADESIWAAEVPFTDGSVGVDLGRDERRTLDLVLANSDDRFSPSPVGFWYDKILRVRRGVELDGTRYEFDLGFFLIDQITPGNLAATVSVSGRDYTKKMMKSHIEAAETFKATDRVEVVIRSIAYNAGISRLDVPFTGETLGKEVSFDADTARWDMVKEIANTFAYDVYFSQNGTFTMRKQADPVTSPSVLTIGEAGRNTLNLDPSTNDGELFNHVVVASSNDGDTLPVWASVENNEPSSPTRIERIGRRTKRIESALATTKTQCLEQAEKFLAVSGLEQFSISFSSLNYPWLDVGNVITVDNPDATATDPDRFLLTSLSIPMAVGPMGGDCKRITVVGNDNVTGGGGTSVDAVVWGDEEALSG